MAEEVTVKHQKAGVKPEQMQRRRSESSGGGQQEGKGCVADGMTYSLAHNTVQCISSFLCMVNHLSINS